MSAAAATAAAAASAKTKGFLLCFGTRRRWVHLVFLVFVVFATTPLPSLAVTTTRLVDILNHYKNEYDDDTALQQQQPQQQQQDSRYEDVYEGNVTQVLDHFRLGHDNRTFQQRYFYTGRYVNPTRPQQLVFLCVGGEGPALTKAVLVDSVHCTGDMLETARRLYENQEEERYSIHLYALEHRYYGKSFPIFETDHNNNNNNNNKLNASSSSSPVTNEHLVYLSSRQAQADLAHFVATQNVHLMLGQEQQQQNQGLRRRRQQQQHSRLPWITFGGSYPGVMAAYARLRFPHSIAAAVSSSAPVQPLLDFAGYHNHVAKVLNDTTVGGSPACFQIFVNGHAQLAFQIETGTTAQRQRVMTEFGICDNSATNTSIFDNPRNVQVFLGDGVTSVGTQDNDPSCTEPLCNIAKKCAALLEYVNEQGDSPAQALARLERQRKALQRKEQNEHKLEYYSNNNDDDENGVSDDVYQPFDDDDNQLNNDNDDNDDDDYQPNDDCTNISWEDAIAYLSDPTNYQAGWRSWLWQTCTEFGFYQTCEVGSACPFGRGYHPLSMDLEICQRAFGVKPTSVARAVQETTQYYGGWDLAATRVLSVNGDVDPWSELALLHSSPLDDERPAFVVPGASHHFWTHPIKESDSLEVAGARELIYATIEQWLDEIDAEWSQRPVTFVES